MMAVPPPGQSIYLWMYRKGLSMVPIDDVLEALLLGGHTVRPKDLRNYWAGWQRRQSGAMGPTMLDGIEVPPASRVLSYDEYPVSPYLGTPEVMARWVPCNADNRPMIKWGNGCMTLASAKACRGCRYLAENLRSTRLLVIDVDGDHGDGLDVDALRFFARWRDLTCCHDKPRLVLDAMGDSCLDLHTAALPTSYHLTFFTTKVIPTMHFPAAHVDLIGNRRNSLRYFKDKTFNGLEPMEMDDRTWDEMFEWIEERSMT